jgi:metal-responsive CopG/Arc/MetJ family transcriptional regulator
MLKFVGFKEQPEILEMVDAIVKESSIDRSAFIRSAIREKLLRIANAREIKTEA